MLLHGSKEAKMPSFRTTAICGGYIHETTGLVIWSKTCRDVKACGAGQMAVVPASTTQQRRPGLPVTW